MNPYTTRKKILEKNRFGQLKKKNRPKSPKDAWGGRGKSEEAVPQILKIYRQAWSAFAEWISQQDTWKCYSAPKVHSGNFHSK